jgi:hypothetical protein
MTAPNSAMTSTSAKQAGHSQSLQQETAVQLQQASVQAALAHRERLQNTLKDFRRASPHVMTGWRATIWLLSASPLPW